MEPTVGIVIMIILVILGFMHGVVWRKMMQYKRFKETFESVALEPSAEYFAVYYVTEEHIGVAKQLITKTSAEFASMFSEAPVIRSLPCGARYEWGDDIKIALYIKNDNMELPFVNADNYFYDVDLGAEAIGALIMQETNQPVLICCFNLSE